MHCDQGMFDILVCGGCEPNGTEKDVCLIDGVTFKNVKKLADTEMALESCLKAFYIDAEVYLFGTDDYHRRDRILVF